MHARWLQSETLRHSARHEKTLHRPTHLTVTLQAQTQTLQIQTRTRTQDTRVETGEGRIHVRGPQEG